MNSTGKRCCLAMLATIRPGASGMQASITISAYSQLLGVADAVLAVQFARGNSLLVAVKSGGHNVVAGRTCVMMASSPISRL
jgi:hypothetical protein